MGKLATEYTELDTIRIAYRQHGSGQPLLLLHGNSVSKSIFKDYQLKHFPMFHTLAVDSRGHGQSKSVDEEYSIKQYSDDIIDFCKAKGIDRAYVIGYSDGGNIALFLASQAPEIFTRVVAISPNTLVSGTTEGALRLIQRLDKLMVFLKRVGINMKKQRMRFKLMLTDIGISEAELKSIRTSLKIIYAEQDMIKEEHLQWLATLVPGSTIHKVPDCTHISILHSPKAIELMKNYLLVKYEN